MPEIVTLTTPLPATSTLRIADVEFNVRHSLVRVTFAEWAAGDWVPNGREILAEWGGAAADAALIAANKRNFSSGQSMAQWIFTQATIAGKLPPGTQSGSVP
jgi:hypothetical protein